MSFDLKLHAYRLLMDEPFFAALSRKIEKRASTAIPTAGVRVCPDTAQFEMIYNPDFFDSLPEEQVKGVLKHEFYHLIFEHVTSRRPEGVNHKVWNICADLAINSHLVGELPDNCCMPGVGPFEGLPKGESAEWYLANFPERPEGEGEGEGEGEPGEGSGEGSGEGESFDDHSGWSEDGDSPAQEAANQMAKERLKQGMKEAAKEASQNPKGWGTMSAAVKKEIIKRLETKVDWRKVMRYFIKTSQRASRRSSVKRINRRYAYIHPGKKVQRQAKIAIAIDQSGSVSDDMLASFFGELNKLAKLAEFTVIPFDTEVAEDKVFIWKKGSSQAAERVMCGGTCFNAPTDYINKNSFDGVIILTDMEAPKPKACKAQRMWMTDQRGASRPYFQTNEKVIAID
jgi:predicted metal-dependent peptidase|tara:strand:- start:4 stop:1200 length:1197 start_codon:yes stop_codon:yes gene_type:complete